MGRYCRVSSLLGPCWSHSDHTLIKDWFGLCWSHNNSTLIKDWFGLCWSPSDHTVTKDVGVASGFSPLFGHPDQRSVSQHRHVHHALPTLSSFQLCCLHHCVLSRDFTRPHLTLSHLKKKNIGLRQFRLHGKLFKWRWSHLQLSGAKTVREKSSHGTVIGNMTQTTTDDRHCSPLSW